MRQGFSKPDDGESGKDQTGAWQCYDEGELFLMTTRGSIARS